MTPFLLLLSPPLPQLWLACCRHIYKLYIRRGTRFEHPGAVQCMGGGKQGELKRREREPGARQLIIVGDTHKRKTRAVMRLVLLISLCGRTLCPYHANVGVIGGTNEHRRDFIFFFFSGPLRVL